MKRIISIRGGGVKGIIPACCLIELERQLGGLTRDHIDMVAGCSTGALLTGAIAAGISATKLLSVYTDLSKNVFTTGIFSILGSFGATVKRGLKGYMYDPKNLKKVLVDLFGPAASWTVNDCPIRVLICTTSMNEQNVFFVQDNPLNGQLTGKANLIDAAVASACAPTFFKWWPVSINGKVLKLYDGGVGGNANPSHQACVQAFEHDNFPPEQTRLIDIGTGNYAPPKDPPAPNDLIDDIGFATGSLVDNSESEADFDAREQWPDVITTLNPELPSNISEDDLSAIPTLVQIGQAFAKMLDWKSLLAL